MVFRATKRLVFYCFPKRVRMFSTERTNLYTLTAKMKGENCLIFHSLYDIDWVLLLKRDNFEMLTLKVISSASPFHSKVDFPSDAVYHNLAF